MEKQNILPNETLLQAHPGGEKDTQANAAKLQMTALLQDVLSRQVLPKLHRRCPALRHMTVHLSTQSQKNKTHPSL